jgi:hypothetical protein
MAVNQERRMNSFQQHMAHRHLPLRRLSTLLLLICKATEADGLFDPSPSIILLKCRRGVFQSAVAFTTAACTILLNTNDAVLAADQVQELQQQQQQGRKSKRPYAPTVEALVPGTQVRVSLQKASQLTTTWINTTNGIDRGDAVLQQLRDLFDATTTPARPSVLAQPQRSPKLSGRAVRSALNAYTVNLRFGENYILTAPPEQRKQLIRNDALPNVQTVITADLDLRDLYRNQIQTAVDDVQAELLLPTPDPLEVRTLLLEARTAIDAWFMLIDDFDVQAADSKLKQQQQGRSSNNN